MTNIFYVIEIQTTSTGAILPFDFEDRQHAEEKYHELLRIAAVSEIPKHGAMMFTDDGFVLKSEMYNHIPEPEPNT